MTLVWGEKPHRDTFFNVYFIRHVHVSIKDGTVQCMRKLPRISYLEHMTNDWVQSKINFLVGPLEPFLATVKRRKLAWLEHVTCPDSRYKTILRGTSEVSRRRAGWTTSESGHPCLCQNCSQGTPAEKTGRGSLLDRTSCAPWRPNQSRDWTELNWNVRRLCLINKQRYYSTPLMSHVRRGTQQQGVSVFFVPLLYPWRHSGAINSLCLSSLHWHLGPPQSVPDYSIPLRAQYVKGSIHVFLSQASFCYQRTVWGLEWTLLLSYRTHRCRGVCLKSRIAHEYVSLGNIISRDLGRF